MNSKLFFVLLFFFFLITVFAGGTIGDTDLTPDTPPSASGSNSPGALAPVVQGIQTGGVCGSPYSIRSGDTLSAIARDCALNLPDLLAANPQITNPNLIQVGQLITIPEAAAQPALPVVEAPAPQQPEATATPAAEAAAQPDAPQPEQPAAQQPAPTEDAILSVFETARASGSGNERPPVVNTPQPDNSNKDKFVAGALIEVVVQGLPANVAVMVGIGQLGSDPFYIDERITNDQGGLIVEAGIPANALPGETWIVTVTTMGDSPVSATSEPFTIER